MCLESLSFTTNEDGVGTGFKVMYLGPNDAFSTPYWHAGPYKVGEWADAPMEWSAISHTTAVKSPRKMITNEPFPTCPYAAGFHIFLKKEDAFEYLKAFGFMYKVCAVEFDKIVAFGKDSGFDCIIARKMRILSYEERQ